MWIAPQTILFFFFFQGRKCAEEFPIRGRRLHRGPHNRFLGFAACGCGRFCFLSRLQGDCQESLRGGRCSRCFLLACCPQQTKKGAPDAGYEKGFRDLFFPSFGGGGGGGGRARRIEKPPQRRSIHRMTVEKLFPVLALASGIAKHLRQLISSSCSLEGILLPRHHQKTCPVMLGSPGECPREARGSKRSGGIRPAAPAAAKRGWSRVKGGMRFFRTQSRDGRFASSPGGERRLIVISRVRPFRWRPARAFNPVQWPLFAANINGRGTPRLLTSGVSVPPTVHSQSGRKFAASFRGKAGRGHGGRRCMCE